MHWPPAGAGNRSSRPGGGGTTGLRPFAGGRECFLPLAPAHAEGAPESGRRQQDTPPGREEEFTKGEKPPKKEGRGAGETMRRGGVGETVQGRRCRGETMQGRDDAGERRCRGDDAAHREKAEPPIQGTRTTDSPKTTTYPENPAPLKKTGSPGKPRLLPEKPRPARIRKKTPAGRCRE